MKDLIGVQEVTVSNRLETSKAGIVTNEYGWNGYMNQVIANRTNQAGAEFKKEASIKHLEINPEHLIIRKLNERIAADMAKLQKNSSFLKKSGLGNFDMDTLQLQFGSNR